MNSNPAIPALVFAPGDSQTDYAALYAIATTYAHSGLLISKHGDKSGFPAFALPAIVCSSFAIELFLKFFLMWKRANSSDPAAKPEHGHFLIDLWKEILPEHQALIAGMHRNKTGVPLLNAPDIRIQHFVEALNEVGKAPFVKWRYAHEFKDVTVMSHAAVADVVDALGHAAEYVMTKERTEARSKDTSLKDAALIVDEEQDSDPQTVDAQLAAQVSDSPLPIFGAEFLLLDRESPLRRIPSNLDPKAAFFLDGIRYAAEFMDVTFHRIRKTLTDLALDPPEQSELPEIIDHVFLDAWGFIEAVSRFHALYTQFPGMKASALKGSVPSLSEATLEFQNLQKLASDLPKSAESMISKHCAVLGELSWLTGVQLEPEVTAWQCLLRPGALLASPPAATDPLVNGVDWPTFSIKLSAGGYEANFSEVRKHVGFRLKHLEAQLPTTFDAPAQAGVPVANDLLGRRLVKMVWPPR